MVEDVIKRQSDKCFERTAEAFNSLHKLTQDPEGRAIIQEKFMLVFYLKFRHGEAIVDYGQNGLLIQTKQSTHSI